MNIARQVSKQKPCRGHVGSAVLMLLFFMNCDVLLARPLSDVATALLEQRSEDAIRMIDSKISQGADDAEKLQGVREAVVESDRLNHYVIEFFSAQIDNDIRIPFQGRQLDIRVNRVLENDQVELSFRDGDSWRPHTLDLEEVGTDEKVLWARGMPREARAICTALHAWESRDLTTFERFAAHAGPLGYALMEAALEKIRSEVPDHRIVVEGFEDREWEVIEESTPVRMTADVLDRSFRDPTADPETSPSSSEIQKTGLAYDLYVPEGYNENKDRWYPVMFISSPGGSAQMGRMGARLRRDQWVVVMLQDSGNRIPQSTYNFVSSYDDVRSRVRVAPGAFFTAGLSGGARRSSTYPAMRPGFRGVIAQAAAFSYSPLGVESARSLFNNYPAHVASVITMGNADSNIVEIRRVRMKLNRNTPLLIHMWEGGHRWALPDVFERSLDWIEETVFVRSRTPVEYYSEFSGISVPAEQTHPVAYLWFFNRTLERAGSASTDYERLYHLQRLSRIAENGGIEQDPYVAHHLTFAKLDIAELMDREEVRAAVRVEDAMREFEEHMQDFRMRILRKPGNTFLTNFDYSYTSQERLALQSALDTAQRIVEEFPDTPQGRFLRGYIPSIKYEMELGEK